MIKKRLLTFLFVFLLIVPFFAQGISANADDLVIQDDGKVILIITNNSGVLGETTTKATSTKESAKPATTTQQPNVPQQNQNKPQSAPPPPSNQTPQKTVPLVAAHTQSTVQINPPINNDKKIQVTITTGVAPQAPAPTVNQPAKTSQVNTTPNITGTALTNSSSKSSPTPPVNAITKTVDQVVAQGVNEKPVISITSNKANQLTIQQGVTQATTSLPLQIDTLTHLLSVPQSGKISVLPTEALQGVTNKGLLDTQNINQAKISLTKDTNGINYTFDGQKQGKLFGFINVKSPVQVKLSAQNGKVFSTSQSLLFNALGGFIK